VDELKGKPVEKRQEVVRRKRRFGEKKPP